jgi:hypothetical protein
MPIRSATRGGDVAQQVAQRLSNNPTGVTMPDAATAGTISSWVAAGIALATVGLSTARAIWNRPIVNWTLVGEMQTVGSYVRGNGTVSNFGDGDAHRVTVYLSPSAAHPEGEVLARSPLLKPGDSLEIDFNVGELVYDYTSIWVTWTNPPIRRHRQKKSEMPLNKHLPESESFRWHIDRRRREQEQGQAVSDAILQRTLQKHAEKQAEAKGPEAPLPGTPDATAT